MSDPIVCFCLRKKQSEILRRWHELDDPDPSVFMGKTEIGTVCTSCRHDVRKLLVSAKKDPTAFIAGEKPQEIIYSTRHQPMLSPWKRFRRTAGRWKKRLLAKAAPVYHLVYRNQEGFSSRLHLLNLEARDFRGQTVPITAAIEFFSAGGDLIKQEEFHLPVDGRFELDTTAYVANGSGLLRITLKPQHIWDKWRWHTGSNRPYMEYTSAEGLSASIHEKTLDFNTPTTIPGVHRLFPARSVDFLIGNASEHAGSVKIDLVNAQGSMQRMEVGFKPHAFASFHLPEQSEGADVVELKLSSDIGFSGYQFTTGPGRGFSVQHLVKEGH